MKGFNIEKIKKILVLVLPLLIFFWLGNKVSFTYRTVTVVGGLGEKALPFLENIGEALISPLPSFHPIDLLIGILVALIAKLVLNYRKKHKKNFAEDEEYGSAHWGNEKDIKPYMDEKRFENNIILTQTERLTIGKPSSPKYARNQNVLVVGGSGSGKTRFYAKPNIMQMFGSYVITDPNGNLQ